jgi:hypothetical protein
VVYLILFANEVMKELEMRLPSSKAKCFKVVGNQLCFDDDELAFGDTEAAHSVGHWKQGFQFVVSRMLKHEDPLVCDPVIIQDRMAFLQMVNELKFDDGAFKLKTVNEFLRRVGASKSRLRMPEVVVHQLMFAGTYHEAAEAAAQKRRINEGGATSVSCRIEVGDADVDADTCQAGNCSADEGDDGGSDDGDGSDSVADTSSPAQGVFEGA